MKWLLGVIFLLLVAAGTLFYLGYFDAYLNPPPPPAPEVVTPKSQSGLPTADTDASDQAISQDSAAIGTQLSALVQDEAAVDASLSDKQVVNAQAEVDRRLSVLQTVAPQVSAMKKVTVEFKQNLSLNVQNQIEGLTALKNAIASSTVTAAYRVFALLVPQVTIAAAADRVVVTVDMMVGVGNKLQSRIAALPQGDARSALSTLLEDLGENLTNAQVQAQTALDNSASLSPDQGEASRMQENTASLKKARAALADARASLVAAQQAIRAIVQGLTQPLPAATTTSQVEVN